MDKRGQNESLRVLDDFICEAIHNPAVPLTLPNKRGQDEGMRVLECPSFGFGPMDANQVSDNETWVIEEGDRVIQKKARCGLENLTPWERLVYCLWVADYGVRNAGDIDTSKAFFPDFQSVAIRAAKELSLRLTCEMFSMEPTAFEEEYLDRFNAICHEVRSFQPRHRA